MARGRACWPSRTPAERERRSGRWATGQLYVSVNTVKTHTHHLYAKLGVHRRHQAVERTRALGLLAPSPRRP
jgi:Bacterial regulatory proteins, luxR family